MGRTPERGRGRPLRGCLQARHGRAARTGSRTAGQMRARPPAPERRIRLSSRFPPRQAARRTPPASFSRAGGAGGGSAPPNAPPDRPAFLARIVPEAPAPERLAGVPPAAVLTARCRGASRPGDGPGARPARHERERGRGEPLACDSLERGARPAELLLFLPPPKTRCGLGEPVRS